MSEQSDVLKRFIRYCEVASQSNPLTADTVPSTPAQHAMAQTVAKDLEELGAEDIMVDTHAYVTAHWPASAGAENLPTLGFCCHLDTAWQSFGAEVHPRVVRYEGGVLGIGTDRDGREVTISPKTNPQLENMVGFDLVTSDGTSLLGGDDKAGVAMVVSLLHRLRETPSFHTRVLQLRLFRTKRLAMAQPFSTSMHLVPHTGTPLTEARWGNFVTRRSMRLRYMFRQRDSRFIRVPPKAL